MSVADDAIKHVVLLMMENHSFDQMMGCLQEVCPGLEGVDINAAEARFNLDLAGNKVDDPVIQYSSTRIGSAFFALIAIESVLRDLDQEHDVFRLGNSISVIITVSPHNGDIRFGLVEIGYPDGVLLAAPLVR